MASTMPIPKTREEAGLYSFGAVVLRVPLVAVRGVIRTTAVNISPYHIAETSCPKCKMGKSLRSDAHGHCLIDFIGDLLAPIHHDGESIHIKAIRIPQAEPKGWQDV